MNKQEVTYKLIEKGVLPVTVNGISMQPTLMKGESIFCKKKEKYKVGDIILFRLPNDELMVHRIIKYNRKGILTKGDNCFAPDDYITENMILGEIRVQEKDKEGIAHVLLFEALIYRFLPRILYRKMKRWKRKRIAELS